jgi:NAD-dependent dihydropyrimidine dehydrogenase PreA subunit
MLREIIEIDEELCNGCGACIPGCAEGALQIIDGKARLISDLLCDGLGACVGHCPEGAMQVIQREAEAYDESKVIASMIPQGINVIRAHLAHLHEHGQHQFVQEAIEYLEAHSIAIPDYKEQTAEDQGCGGGCPGSAMKTFTPKEQAPEVNTSALNAWPVQLHLISPHATQFKNSDMLLASDCSAFTAGNFHSAFLKGKSLAVACPKLDQGQQSYLEKLTALIDEAKINTLTVLIMQVPCCGGLFRLAAQAAQQASRKIPIKRIVLSIQGDVLEETWV